jgi:hypothetical protein
LANATTEKSLLPVCDLELEKLKVLISRAVHETPSGEDAKILLLKEMKLMEERILKWLTGLGGREVLETYKPTEEEITLIQTIAQLYHERVPFMQKVLELVDRRPPVNLFVSHTAGTNKESYAAPLANFLERKGVRGVFIDKNMPVGTKGDDEMMWAAHLY